MLPSLFTVRNIAIELLNEVCRDVRVEPGLQELTDEETVPQEANTSDESRLDISARGFWIPYEKAFFDVRVFNPLAGRYKSINVTMYEVNEKGKKTSV